MPAGVVFWFVFTLILFFLFVGWVIHEILSVGKRDLPEEYRKNRPSL